MITDGIIIILIMFFLWRGISRGFIKSLLGPIAFIIGTALAFFYYNATHNIPISLGIGLLGPILLSWGFSLMFFLACKTSGGGTAPNVLSRLLGGFVTILWGLAMILPIVYLLGFLPPIVPTLKPMVADILTSRTYGSTKAWAKSFHLIPEEKSSTTTTSSSNNDKNTALEEVHQDVRMQALLNDPKVQKAVKEKNYAAMLSNPEIMKMAQDPEFVKKLLAAFQDLQKTK